VETDIELAPAMSRAVLEAAQQALVPSSGSGEIRQRQMGVNGGEREGAEWEAAVGDEEAG
jgi:hypothetical protein